MKRSIPDTAIT